MADYYLQFATAITDLTAAEYNWLQRQLDAELLQAAAQHQAECEHLHVRPEGERKRAYHESRARYRRIVPDGVEPEAFVLLGHYRQIEALRFDYMFERNAQAGAMMCLYAEEQGELEPVADLVQAFLRQFRPAQAWAITWACTCSRPRPDAFSGGCVVIGPERQDWFDATRWAEHRLGNATSQGCRAELASLRSAAMGAVQRHLRSTAEWQLDLDEAGEAVDLGEPAEHAPYIRVVGLDSEGVNLWATVYYPIDVDERSWDATELDEQLNADDAVRLLRAVEQTIASEAG